MDFSSAFPARSTSSLTFLPPILNPTLTMAAKLLFLVALLASANAFTPTMMTNQVSSTSLLGMAVDETGSGSSKRKRAVKTFARTAGVISSVLATTGFPPAALAAKKALQVVEVAKTAEDTHKLLVAGGVIAAGIATAAKLSTKRTSVQDFLEATPYWDQATVPVNVYKNKTPFTGKVVSTKRIVGPKATGETCHIVIDHKGGFPVSSK